jgi:hypothetical protein
MVNETAFRIWIAFLVGTLPYGALLAILLLRMKTNSSITIAVSIVGGIAFYIGVMLFVIRVFAFN